MKWILAILALALAAIILFPVFAQPSQNGHRPVCLSNLKQLSTAMLIYEFDFDDRLPLENWADAILIYLKHEDLLHCPQAAQYGYAMNMEVVGAKVKEEDPKRARTVLLFDTDALGRNVVANLAARSRSRHKGGSNVSYLDARARWVPGDRQP